VVVAIGRWRSLGRADQERLDVGQKRCPAPPQGRVQHL